MNQLSLFIEERAIVPLTGQVTISITPRVIEPDDDSSSSEEAPITPRVIEKYPSGTIGQYRKGDRIYWRYSYRHGRRKSIHKHIGKVGDAIADEKAREVKAMIENRRSISEILKIL